MKIVRHPYQATIIPQAVEPKALWQYMIQRDGSPEILLRREAMTKEDASSLALLDISQLQRLQSTVTKTH
jgi:hypothetical protein